MSDADAPNLVYMVLLLMLVAASLVGMRLPLGRAVKMAAAWVAIFALGFLVFSFRDDFGALGQRLRAEATGAPIVSGETMRIPISDDGHFWVEASVNGHRERFLVDSGATVTTISSQTAEKAGIEAGMRVAMVKTANGVVRMSRVRADRFAVGPIERSDFGLMVSPVGGANVLGMNFLTSLGRWGIEGNYLVLQP